MPDRITIERLNEARAAPVAQKRVVAKERVGVEKDVQTDRETVRDEVRNERVDVDDDAEGG